MPIELRNVCKSFGEKRVLDNVSFTLEDGRAHCIMSPSGSGKTTLLNIMMGLLEPDSGEVLGLEGRRLAPLFQEDRLCENLSAGANLRMVCPRGLAPSAVSEMLAHLGLPGAAHKPVRNLSGGQRRRVALARALLCGGDVYLFDEPFQGLDHDTRAMVMDVVRRNTQGKTLIFVTHDPAEAAFFGCEAVNLP